ncbi:FAR-17a/AIG1-like protein [Mycena crocata]|nr:FAR-17a/AIG1-like protein [Mycena crocata]
MRTFAVFNPAFQFSWLPSLSGLAIDTWITSQYGGHFQFLTIQGLGLACLTMIVGLLEDFLSSIPGIRAIKRALLIAAMSIATIVSSIYWTLLLSFPHLIMEAKESTGAPLLPLSIDLCLHAAPCLTLVADFMFFERKYGRKSTRYTAPAVILLYTVGYGWWAEHCASKNGAFPYPFLTINPLKIRLRIYAGAGTLAYTSFYTLNALHPKSR